MMLAFVKNKTHVGRSDVAMRPITGIMCCMF